jgi:nicotinate-nucleotide adenylyltransferase
MDRETLDKIPHDRVTMVEVPALAISSTDVRRRTMRGEPVWYLVPDGVVQYIAKHHLYPRVSSTALAPASAALPAERSRVHEPSPESTA